MGNMQGTGGAAQPLPDRREGRRSRAGPEGGAAQPRRAGGPAGAGEARAGPRSGPGCADGRGKQKAPPKGAGP